MKNDTTYERNLETATRSEVALTRAARVRILGLTILAHPDIERIGERTTLAVLSSNQDVLLSRKETLFSAPGGSERRALAARRVSRSPLRLTPLPDAGVRLVVRETSTRVTGADGTQVAEDRDFPVTALEDGVVIVLAGSVALLLHLLDPTPQPAPSFDLVGESPAIVHVRHEITRVADVDAPVLLRGETGTGKELVARALHLASARRERPFVAVNMGAFSPALAAAELFGAVKGAYTGADRARTGHFVHAQGGTLFLDEIGETPAEVQVMLLRTLQERVVQPVGSETSRQVDVRILAATDADLEAEIDAGRFRAPLVHRLSGYEIRLPPLRERRDDVARLLVHFLRAELAALGEAWRLEARGQQDPWLPAPVVARLVAHSWPGNVRQLQNVARQWVLSSRGESQLVWSDRIEELLEPPSDSVSRPSEPEPEEPVALPPAAGDPAIGEERSVLRALLLVDLVESPRLVDGLGDRRALQVMSRHDRAARGLLPEYDGYEVDKSDGFLLLFERPADAVGYALEYHETLGELSEELGVELAARAGISLGEVFLRHNSPAEVARGAKALEVEGLSKPMAARLMRLATTGQTLLTRSVFDLARQSARGDHPLADPGVRWLEHGTYRLKGVEEAIEVFEVGVTGSAPLTAPADTAAATPAEDETEEPRPYRAPSKIDEEELVRVLKAHSFRLQPVAAALGISRTSLYALIEKSPRIRKALDLTREEIEDALEHHAGDLDAAAADLEVSRKGLSRRMGQLGLK